MGDGRYLPCWVGRWTPAAVGSCTPLRCGCTPHSPGGTNGSLGGEVFRRNDAACECADGGLCAVLRVEFGEHMPDVRLDGLFADVECGSDLLVRLAERHLPQYLELARREIVACVGAQHAITDRRIDERSSACHRSYRGEQRLGFSVLAHVARGTGTKNAHHSCFISGRRKSDDPHLRRACEHTLRGFDSVDAAG